MRDRASTESEAKYLFGVGIVMGGPEGHPRLTQAVSSLITARDQTPDPEHDEHSVRVNVIYNVPGTIWPVRFTGIEAGAFSRKYKVQAIQVAVPEDLPDDDVLRFVVDTMREAMALAARAVSRRGLSVEEARMQLEATLAELGKQTAGD